MMVHPEALLQKILTLSRLFNRVFIENIMDVVTKQSHPQIAPIVAQGLLDFAQKEAAARGSENSKKLLDVPIYSQVLHAWARSKLREAPSKMEAVVQSMCNDGFAPTAVTYNILLRYWG